jgi:hypothetical protein
MPDTIRFLFLLPQTFFDVNSEAFIKLKLTSRKPDLCVRK